MARDRCLGCGTALPKNLELAVLPHGRLIAFDSATARVWTVCEECNHWNLHGPEVASSALPELVTRYESEASGGVAGIGLVAVSRSLLLFRVGATPSRAAIDRSAAEALAAVGSGGLRWQQGVVALGLLGLGGGIVWLLGRVPIVGAIATHKALLLAMMTMMLVNLLLSHREALRGERSLGRWIWVLIAPSVVIQLFSEELTLWFRLLAVTIGGGLGYYLGRAGRVPRGIRWETGTQRVSYHDGFVGDQLGWSGTTMALYELSRDFQNRVTTPDRDAGWTMWCRAASLQRLLDEMAPKRDSTGLLQFSRLERAERIALFVALGARLAEPPEEILAGLHEAQEVARIAESLD